MCATGRGSSPSASFAATRERLDSPPRSLSRERVGEILARVELIDGECDAVLELDAIAGAMGAHEPTSGRFERTSTRFWSCQIKT